jgi:hypothetical protein
MDGRLVGNRLALGGALLYLSEWIVIPFIPDLPTDDLGADAATVAEAYAGEAESLAFATGLFSFVLVGRFVFVAGLRTALRSTRGLVWMDIALGAMILSVAVEMVQLGLPAAAGWLAEADADPSSIAALDAAGTVLFALVLAPIGVSVVASSVAMLVSGLFSRWLCWFGLVAGTLVIAGGVVGTAGAGTTGVLHDLADPLTGPPVAAFWLWMLATAVVLFRHAPPLREAH